MNTNANPTTPTLADIAATQSATHIFAYDRGHADRQLASLQALYARRRAQLELLGRLFDEGAPTLTIHGETQKLTLGSNLLGDTYTALSEALGNALHQLEKAIVQAHVDAQQWAADVASDYANRTDYVPLILDLCEPAAQLVVSLPTAPLPPTPRPAQHAQAA